MTKLREKQGEKPATQKHLLRQARAHLNVIYLRCYGEMFNTKDVASNKQRAPNYKTRASRRKGACTNHLGACFKNESCANWTNQIQCGKDCPKKDKCGNQFIDIGSVAFKGILIVFVL